MKSGRGGFRPAEKVVAAVAAKGEWDTSRPRLAYSSGKHKEEGNNSRESSTRKNIYGSVIPPCALLEFFFFLATSALPFFFYIFTPAFSLMPSNIFSFRSLSVSFPFPFSLCLSFDCTFDPFDSIPCSIYGYREIVQPIPKLTVLRSTKLDDRRKIWYRIGRGNRSRERFGSSPWLVIPARLGRDIGGLKSLWE